MTRTTEENIKYYEDLEKYLFNKHSSIYAKNPNDERLKAIESEYEDAKLQASMYRQILKDEEIKK